MRDLRSRQREVARQSIVDACAELVTERRHLDFTMKEVAERAGMSLRTVYNHFAAREDLLDALGVTMDEESRALGGPDASELETLDDLLDAVQTNVGIFEQLGGISEALAQMPLAEVGHNSLRLARTKLLTDFIAAQMPSAPPEDAHAIATVLRHMASHRSWFWLTREYGLESSDLTRILNWAIRTLIEAA
ncbi:MAG: TetR/AcrR family transcriptional regulator, partial [Acidimicrobiales bacterium]